MARAGRGFPTRSPFQLRGLSIIGSGPRMVTDTTEPTLNITIGPSTNRISRIAPKDVATFSFQISEDYQAYEIRVVPGPSSPHTAGTLLEAGGSGAGGVDINADVTDDELVAALGVEGDNIIKVFGQDLAGNWST